MNATETAVTEGMGKGFCEDFRAEKETRLLIEEY